jgi:RNA polymerase sigma-70 factor (ECF subfamily)
MVLLYDRLMSIEPSPVVALNRAVAVSMARGPAEALAIVDDLSLNGGLDDYYLLHSTRGELLRRLGRRPEAADAYERAAAMASNAAEREFLERRRAQLAD